MNPIDLAILVVVGLSALLGAIRGFLTEVLSLLAWIAAFVLAFVAGDDLGRAMVAIDPPLLRSLAGHALVFAGVLLTGHLVIWLLRTLVHGIGLSVPDRVFGAGFGAARGYAIVLVGVLVAGYTPWVAAAVWRDATLLPLWSGPSAWVAARLPDPQELAADLGMPGVPGLVDGYRGAAPAGTPSPLPPESR